MLVTLATSGSTSGGLPDGAVATDLGRVLHKHPDRVHVQEVPTGTATVCYPVATPERCEAALLLEVDPVGLVRSRAARRGDDVLARYVNDRPYVASSLLAVALSRVLRTALAGRCDARPELAEAAWPLEVRLPALPVRGRPELVERLFAPLGWEVEARRLPLDELVPAWGDADLVDLTLRGRARVADALSHLYVLLPVLDDAKHYWVGEDEVDKLLRVGGRWLQGHPERELISSRYLAHQRHLASTAAERLAALDRPADAADDADADEPGDDAAPVPARPLVALRHAAVLDALRACGARRVLDLGCGPGALLQELLADSTFTEVVGTDVSARALASAARRLGLDALHERQRARISLLTSSVTYADPRLAGYDAAVLMEVVEHVDPPRLPALEHAVFGVAAPRVVVVTTPNVEANAAIPGLAPGQLRHTDHRFEWTRAEFAAWCRSAAERFGYAVELSGVGPDHPELGAPTQLALLRKESA
ncbi:3' terminal RNA ribose 2'-O-methyltransferase Hen1 [Motilibacter rhizosphaerae]|uniref:Small RNA 2'-O-methyltransferase n=1 Tax=Motilibacter rhizosphaerae TaxID=598652 RepID=A0A4Q7NW84_9ACTN|nr:3' terminal RNA ribose 2'-O-methyltransferase Hen1 [Motilibacter rhizosphaerae]RZS91556.1 3' terminal RNA ribose 2'-O-methyltransferase Hen1 [Motilibacter rhizosphaerae]